ncbi:hypothetical protein COM13_12940 [Bacillus pseudomycoides]|uniref:hypothetical protein n=1 Tax=Bacillus pseudomycoides TaxID=64104 RepID=UPI000BED8346|nr:hypothetical protein [Bacillus pseudomycoides]PDX99378.1 hypothetical protein COO07_17130 [Bacillus pseudomycoides]PEK83183.1 hypothetical protein CN597_00505 [Bacillus pseudomycoides]PEN09007.1 hypothetical protein CN640_12790 [Bacillus pseudomycoides]PGB88880.1 hypothetical protein COM13_12940 [Bacillus pseudomycoides]
MKQNQITELKRGLSILYGNYRGLNIIAETEGDFEELERIDKEIDSIKCKLLELTGDDRYNPSIEAVVKKYRRGYWDFREYGAISLSELYKRKQAKIEIIKHKHKQNGVTNCAVTMGNIHFYHVDKAEIDEYLANYKMTNRRKGNKSLRRRKNQFNMIMKEMRTYAFYFDTHKRIEEVHDLVRQVFGPNKRATDAKLNEIRKVIKLTKMLRNQL